MGDGDPLGRAATIRLLDRHGVAARKALGQHFLADPNVVRKIVAAAEIGPGDRVVEIGAGTGTLTRALANTGAAVVAYEVDERLRPILDEVLRGCPADVRFADAGSVDFAAALGPGPWSVVANLPYNVGTPLLLDLLRRVPAITRFVVMLQREAVERLVAPPGSRTYGLPSVVVRLHGSPRLLFRVSPAVFVPPPQVESAVVAIVRHPPSPHVEGAIGLAAAAFARRRKMLRSSLRPLLGNPADALDRAGIAPELRAEQVAPEEYVRLAEVVDAG